MASISIDNVPIPTTKGGRVAAEKLKTLIVVILDESSSMKIQQEAVIGGYNNFLKQQRELLDDKARLLLVKFNTEVKVGHAAIDIEATPGLSYQNYSPYGGTALYDAVAEGIRIGEGAIQPGERVIVLIMTDGEENSSRRCGSADVKKLIASHEALGNWTFVYIGANPERWSQEMGQHFTNSCGYNLQTQAQNFATVSAVTSEFRIQACAQQQQGLMSNQPQFIMQQQQMPGPPRRQTLLPYLSMMQRQMLPPRMPGMMSQIVPPSPPSTQMEPQCQMSPQLQTDGDCDEELQQNA